MSWSGRLAFAAFAIYVVAALPLLVMELGRYHWFFGDEWSFLAERDAGDVGDLFQSHGEHWSTIPILVYRGLFNAFGLGSYAPYQTVVVVAHLSTAVMLRVVMRRSGVSPWIATAAASVLVLFGPGQENIVWAFQIGFVGALLFGLVHLVLADHPGHIDRRDWYGLLAGALSMMCSGVSLVMLVVVSLLVLCRRCRRAAAFHTIPLGLMYATWFVVTEPSGIENPYGRGAHVRELVRFVWSGIRGAFEGLAAFRPLAFVLAALFVVTFVVTSRQVQRRGARALAAPQALAIGAVLFLLGTGYTRWFITPVADNQSRYIYTLAVFALPALALGADATARRWPVTFPLLIGLFVVPIVANIDEFGARPPFTSSFHERSKAFTTALAVSAEASEAPPYVRPNPWYTIGWLRDTAVDNNLPSPPASISPSIARHIPLILGVAQLDNSKPAHSCATFERPEQITPARGDTFAFRFERRPKLGTSWFVQNSIVVTRLDVDGKPISRVGFKSDFGSVLQITTDDLILQLSSGDPSQGLILCR